MGREAVAKWRLDLECLGDLVRKRLHAFGAAAADEN